MCDFQSQFFRDNRKFLLFFHPTGVHPTLVFTGGWNLKCSRRTEFLYWIMVKNHWWKYIFFNKAKLILKNINFYLVHPKWKHFSHIERENILNKENLVSMKSNSFPLTFPMPEQIWMHSKLFWFCFWFLILREDLMYVSKSVKQLGACTLIALMFQLLPWFY